jgi:hypothetical protein
MTKLKRVAKLPTSSAKRHAILAKMAKRLVRKADGYQPKAEHNHQIPADCCGVNGLRPVWHGRAS